MTIKRLALILFGFLSFLLGMEGAVRIEDWIRYGTPLFVDALSQSDLIATDSLGTHGRPNGRFRKWKLNSLGYRGPEISQQPHPGTIRIVTSGASETFGLTEDSGREFPRQLEDSLNSLLRQESPACAGDHRFEVVNAALPGMYLPTAIADVQKRLSTIAPDAILYYPSPPQYLDLLPPRAFTPRSGELEAASKFRPFYPRSIGRIREALKGLIPSTVSRWIRREEINRIVRQHPPGWQFTTVPNDRLDLYERDIRQMIGAIRGIGAVPILATHANIFEGHRSPRDEELLLMWQRFSPRSNGPTLIAFDSAANDRLERIASDSGVLLARVDKTLSATPEEGLFSDYVHFTNKGASFVAEATAHPVFSALLPLGCAVSERNSPDNALIPGR